MSHYLVPARDASAELEVKRSGSSPSYAEQVSLRIGLTDPQPLAGWPAELTAGRVGAAPAGQRWVDVTGT